MIRLTLSEVADALDARIAGDTPPLSLSGVSTDSRTVQLGELFFALSGPNFDGHDFAAAALARGAGAVVIAARRAARVSETCPREARGVLLEVQDPLTALWKLAEFHRRQLALHFIAVVGTNGKTTTKAMIDHVLGGTLRGGCSQKSFNNEIGVPLTLLSARPADDYLVVEIGTNSPGEVARLAGLVQPDMAVITCLGEEHLEGLVDLDGVAAEECSILAALRAGGFAAVNIDAPQVRAHLTRSDLAVITFGRDAGASLRVTRAEYSAPWLSFTINDRFAYRLSAAGIHNAVNAAAAISVARRLGLSHEQIAARLESFVLPPMRAERQQVAGVTIINDAYNANPHSALASIELLESLAVTGRRILVFGEMRELGPRSAELHRRVAQQIAGSNIDRVLLIGPAADHMFELLQDGRLFGPRVAQAASLEAALPILTSWIAPNDAVLLKASRAVGLERLVAPLREHLQSAVAA